jgi:parvulin-like peptidyl-prolyl isomerase
LKKILLTILTIGFLFSASSKTLATVDNEKITEQDLKEMVASVPNMDYENLPPNVKERAINQLIDKKLLYKYAKNRKVGETKEFKEAIKSVKKEIMVQVFLANEMDKIKISNTKVKNFYNKNKMTYFATKQEAKARHILVKDEKVAKAIIKTLNKTKSSKIKKKFIALAKEKSEGPSGANGGDLGWFSAEKMVPAFSKSAFSLKKGSYTKKPVKTQFGYHIIYLEDKKQADVKKFSKVKQQIKQSLQQQKFAQEIKKVLKRLRDKAKIDTF